MKKKTNLRDRDDLSTRDIGHFPKVSLSRRFHCRLFLSLGGSWKWGIYLISMQAPSGEILRMRLWYRVFTLLFAVSMTDWGEGGSPEWSDGWNGGTDDSRWERDIHQTISAGHEPSWLLLKSVQSFLYTIPYIPYHTPTTANFCTYVTDVLMHCILLVVKQLQEAQSSFCGVMCVVHLVQRSFSTTNTCTAMQQIPGIWLLTHSFLW